MLLDWDEIIDHEIKSKLCVCHQCTILNIDVFRYAINELPFIRPHVIECSFVKV